MMRFVYFLFPRLISITLITSLQQGPRPALSQSSGIIGFSFLSFPLYFYWDIFKPFPLKDPTPPLVLPRSLKLKRIFPPQFLYPEFPVLWPRPSDFFPLPSLTRPPFHKRLIFPRCNFLEPQALEPLICGNVSFATHPQSTSPSTIAISIFEVWRFSPPTIGSFPVK